MTSKSGEIWRLTNASGSATYDLHLASAAQKRDMLFQVISLDGVSVSPARGASSALLTSIAAGRFRPEACPSSEFEHHRSEPICTRVLHLMPSSRAEVWVAYRDSKDRLAPAPKSSYAVFRTDGYQTGPSGDAWPQVDLARVEFQTGVEPSAPAAMSVDGEASAMSLPVSIAQQMGEMNTDDTGEHCSPLPSGHMRRIFYGVPTDNPDAFGTGL